MPISKHDEANVDRIMGGYGDWFTAHLLRLINKADHINLAKLQRQFPDEVAAVKKWRDS